MAHPLSRLRLVLAGRRTGCRHCDRLLLPCPHGPACPGHSSVRSPVCTDCSWGLRCPRHGRRWITA
ncbi:hypothetical protein [Trujillonella humicola]|uniref:hypothetical protein n=1 Tax=Trujillonella humicola TaxID=3383699 RepID=UPI0039064FAA